MSTQLYRIRLYAEAGQDFKAAVFDDVPAEDQHEARTWGKKVAEQLGIKLDGGVYVDWVRTP